MLVIVLFCVIDRQLEAMGISDHVMLDYVCDLKVLILGGSYPSAATTHRGQVFLFVCCFLGGRGGGGGGGGMAGDEIFSYPVH